jgi:hypothetical protein
MADMESFIFGAGTPNLDYQALAQRRAIAQALAGRKRELPTTIGTGLASFGESLADAVDILALGQKERSQRAAESKLIGGAPEGPAYTGTLPGAAPTPATGAPRADLQIEPQLAPGFYAGGDDEALANKRAAGIGGIETGGQANPYQALGPVTKTGDRAYGRYQVMGANIPAWSKATLGAELTPEQFLASKEAQDDIFRNQFGGYADKYGEQGAARAWLGGEGSIDKPGRADQLGTTVGAYGDRYMASLGGAPTRMAAVNLPGSTINDAAPIAAAPAASPNPPTVVADIKPKSAAGSLPSAEPIPGASKQVMEPPGDEPQRPGIIGPTKPMVYWSNIMNNPNVSPGVQAYAKQKFDQEREHLTGIQQRVDEEYTHKRGVWQKGSDEYKKFVREEPDRAIAQLKERIGIQNTQVGIEKATLDLAKAYYEQAGGGWDAALDKAKSDAVIAKRTAERPDKETINGVIYEKQPGSTTWAPAPGSPTDEKLSETQARGFKALQRATVAQSIVGDGAQLRSFMDNLATKIPGGNFLMSPEYQRKHSAMMAWGTAVLRDESGAVLSPSEVANKLHTFFAQPGDSDQLIAEKAARRQYEEQSIYQSLGDKKNLADKWYEHRKAQKTDRPEGFAETSSKGRTRKVIGGHWVYPDEW